MPVQDNSGALLDLIRSGGIISRVQLAAQSGLTEASVSRIVKQLISDGIVAETGRGTSTGGKRPTLLQLNKSARHAVGIYLSDFRIRYVVTDLAGRVVAATESEDGTVHHTRADVVERSMKAIDALLIAAGVSRDTLLGIGIAVPGRQEINTYQQNRYPGAWTEWDWRLIQHDFAAAAGMPVEVENDSTCGALGEFWISRSPASKDLAVVTVAAGIGFGLVTRGDVYRGASSNVGEFGHVVVNVDGPACACGSRGCLELYAAPRSIVRDALADDMLRVRLGLTGDPDDVWGDFERIAAAAVSGDDDGARVVVVSAARILGAALVSATNVLDLDRIVLTGPGLDLMGSLVAETVAEELSERAFSRNVHPTEVRLSESGRDAAAVGAATLVIHRQLGAVRRVRTPATAEPAGGMRAAL